MKILNIKDDWKLIEEIRLVYINISIVKIYEILPFFIYTLIVLVYIFEKSLSE